MKARRLLSCTRAAVSGSSSSWRCSCAPYRAGSPQDERTTGRRLEILSARGAGTGPADPLPDRSRREGNLPRRQGRSGRTQRLRSLQELLPGLRSERLPSRFSVTKSVISALVGVALKEDRLESVDQRLSEFFPEHFSSGTDPRKRQITVGNLLTMTNGFRLNTFDNEGLEDRIMTSDDVVEASIEQPMAKEPGEEFNYNDWGAHLISAILTWEGRQIVPRRYVRTSTREQVEAAPYTEGYGYFWWT